VAVIYNIIDQMSAVRTFLPRTLRGQLVRYGHPFRPVGAGRLLATEDVVAAYEEHGTIGAAAKAPGSTKTTVHRILKKTTIVPR